jgi:hypothetical protein
MGEWGRLKKELHDWLRPWEKLKREKGKGKAEKGIASGCALPSNGCYGARVERCQGAGPASGCAHGKTEKGKGKAEKGIASGCALPSNGCYGARVERCQGADPPQAAPMGKLKREKGKLKREN